MKRVSQTLHDAAEIYEERNAIYGDNYKNFGFWASRLFIDGVTLKTENDWCRMGVLMQILSKLSRYANNWSDGGHKDSLDDMIVYAGMLQELDGEFAISQQIAESFDSFPNFFKDKNSCASTNGEDHASDSI